MRIDFRLVSKKLRRRSLTFRISVLLNLRKAFNQHHKLFEWHLFVLTQIIKAVAVQNVSRFQKIFLRYPVAAYLKKVSPLEILKKSSKASRLSLIRYSAIDKLSPPQLRHKVEAMIKIPPTFVSAVSRD